MSARVLVAPFLGAACLLAATSSHARPSASGPCSSGNVATTASYRMALDIGKQEEMYLPSEVKARHIKEGEIMLGGEMSMIGSAPAGSADLPRRGPHLHQGRSGRDKA